MEKYRRNNEWFCAHLTFGRMANPQKSSLANIHAITQFRRADGPERNLLMLLATFEAWIFEASRVLKPSSHSSHVWGLRSCQGLPIAEET